MKRIAIVLAMALAAGMLRGEGELPDGYTRVEYIEPNGVGEYIDTEFCPTTNTCIAAEFTALPQTDENGVLFGVSDGKEIQDEEGNVIEDPSSSVLLRYNGGTGNLNGWFCNTNASEAVSVNEFGGDPSVTTKVKLESGRMLLNGDTYAVTTTGMPVKASIYVFACNRGGIASNPQAMRLRAFDIFTNGVHVCEFVPCVNDKERVGLFDLKSGKFHPLNPPAGYLALKSIVAARGAYIDSGYKPNDTSRVMMDVDVHGKAEFWFSVSGADYTHDAYALCNDDVRGIYYAVGDDGGSAWSTKSADGCVPNGLHTVGITPYSFLVDGEVWMEKVPQRPFQLEHNLFFFASNSSVDNVVYTPDTQKSVTCLGCRIYESDTLVHNFVPCVNSSGRSGLYDFVKGEFLPLQLPVGYIPQDSVVVPRGDYIDTGYLPNQATRVLMDVTVQSSGEYWFGCWDWNYNVGAYALGNDGANGVYFGMGANGCNYIRSSTGGGVLPGRHTVEIDDWVSKFDGVKSFDWREAEKAVISNFQLKYSLYLFAQNRRKESSLTDTQREMIQQIDQGSIICHGCAISENGVLQRSYVPCSRYEDGVVGLYETATGNFHEYGEKRAETVGEAYYYYYANHDFGAETFVEFSRWQQDELLGFLQAANTAASGGAIAFGSQCKTKPNKSKNNKCSYINVWIILRNPIAEDWVLNDKIVDEIHKLALSKEYTRNISLVIEGNPDCFPSPQLYGSSSVKHAIRSFDAEGGPIVLTYQNNPLNFAYCEKDNMAVPSSLLYGLTFKNCTCNSGDGGAVVTGSSGNRKAVRLVNCRFENCAATGGSGGAVYMCNSKNAADLAPAIARQFELYDGTSLLAADRDGISGDKISIGFIRTGGSNIYHCMFEGCTAKSSGGAIYGKKNGNFSGTVVTDCTFNNCKADGYGGAIYDGKTVYRCTFNGCSVKTGRGGACFDVYNSISSVFRDCSCKKQGGAIDKTYGKSVRIFACTFDKCVSTDKGSEWAFYTAGGFAYGCLMSDSPLPKDGAGNVGYCAVRDGTVADDLYVARGSDYHIKTEKAPDLVIGTPSHDNLKKKRLVDLSWR